MKLIWSGGLRQLLQGIWRLPYALVSTTYQLDTIPTNWKSHVVYHIKCDACNASYIGKTVNTIHERFHVGTESAHLSSKNENSPLITHLHQYPTHSFDTDTVKILCSAPYNTALEIMESLNIQYYKSSLNRNIYSRPLYLFLTLFHRQSLHFIYYNYHSPISIHY